MRVAWIQDNSRPHGGAETSNRCVVAAGENLGFDIVGVTPQNFHQRVLDECDVVIVNNFFQFARPQEQVILDVLWRKKRPYVKYEHDSREIGRPDLAKRLFGESALNVFLSPAHLENHKARLGVDGIALPLAIQTEMFRPTPGVQRDSRKALVVGGWVRGGKISRSIIRYIEDHPELSFLSVGFELPRAFSIPHRPLKDMPGLYSSVGWLVHLPDMVCAGERVIFEAALCGVPKIEMNDKVGHKSWNRDLSDTEGLREWLRKAPFDFWKAVENAVRGRIAC